MSKEQFNKDVARIFSGDVATLVRRWAELPVRVRKMIAEAARLGGDKGVAPLDSLTADEQKALLDAAIRLERHASAAVRILSSGRIRIGKARS